MDIYDDIVNRKENQGVEIRHNRHIARCQAAYRSSSVRTKTINRALFRAGKGGYAMPLWIPAKRFLMASLSCLAVNV